LSLLVAAFLALSAAPAAADTAVGVIDGTNLLVTFDTATPGTFTTQKRVTGLAPGERLAGIDFRHHPNNETNPLPPSQLFGIGVIDGLGSDTVRLYTIDPVTAVATPVGAGVTVPTGGVSYGFDFNPSVDRLRVVNDGDESLRLNPNNGSLSGDDTNLTPPGEKVSGVAYDRVEIQIPPVVSANTTAYAIAVSSASLVTIGSVNQTPMSTNTGIISNPKPLGIALAPGSSAGFDISPAGTAYATLVDGGTGQPGLYTIDLNSGAATPVGPLPEALGGFAVVPSTLLPTPTPVDKTPPTVSLAGVRGSLSLKAFLKGIAIKVMANEPASLEAELLGAAKSAKLASFNLILASKSMGLAAGQRTLTLKPSRRLVGKPTKAFKVSLRIAATDAGGNTGAATKTIKVKPAKKKKKAKR
jgi:hypothetical protein